MRLVFDEQSTGGQPVWQPHLSVGASPWSAQRAMRNSLCDAPIRTRAFDIASLVNADGHNIPRGDAGEYTVLVVQLNKNERS